MYAGSHDEFKQWVATELAQAWARAWSDYDLDFTDPRRRSYALAHACDILSFVLRAPFAGDEQLELRAALSVLQSIGEGYALLSELWPIGKQAVPALPTKENLSRTVAETGVGAWLADQGQALGMAGHEPQRPFGRTAGPPRARPPDEREVGEVVSIGLSEYATFVGYMESGRHRAEMDRQANGRRRLTCARLSALRLMLDSLLPLGSRTEAARRALALMLIVTDSEFVALCSTSDEPLESLPMLRIGFIDEILEETGVKRWLQELGQWPIRANSST